MSLEIIAADAAAAVTLVVPYLAAAGTEAAKTVGKESAGAAIKLLGWLRDKLTGRAAEALGDLERSPDAEDNQADLRKQLAKLLEAEPHLHDELRALLQGPASTGPTITQTVQGSHAKGAQIHGDGNSVTM